MMANIHYLEMFKDSITLVILMFCSILSITFTLERWWFFHKATIDGDALLANVRKLMEGGKTDVAIAQCKKSFAPIAQVVHYGLLHRKRSRLELDELLGSKRLEERLRMEHYLVVLGKMGNTAPFIGLFGTVVGIIKAFRDLALAGAGGPAVVAGGISEALVATAAGMAVAIPAVVVYNYFMRKVKNLSVEMEVVSARLMVMLAAK